MLDGRTKGGSGEGDIPLSESETAKVAADLLGTCTSLDFYIEAHELDVDAETLEDLLLDFGVERCPVCEWWHESGELIDPDDDDAEPMCDQCRSEQG